MSHYLKCNYYLRNPGKNGLTAIYMSATCKGERAILFPNISIESKNWDNKKYKPKPIAENSTLIGKLNTFEEHVRMVYDTLQKEIGAVVPADLLKKAVYGEMLTLVRQPKSVKANAVMITSFFQKFIDDSKNGIRQSPHDTQIKEQSIKPYITTKGHFADFQKSKNKEYALTDIDQPLVNNFNRYLIACKKGDDLSLSLNAVGKYMQVFKTMIQYAQQCKLVSPTLMVEVKIRARREKSDSIFLDENELVELMNYNGFEGATLKVRDLFIIQCYTGLRFGDFSKLGKQHIHESHIEYIECVQNKTLGKVTVPVHPNVKKIFEKYNYELPDCPCNQIFNRELKEIGKKIPSLSQPFTKRTTRSNVKQVKQFKRWQLLSTHTARRSFCSNLYLRGVDTEVIMSLSGHESEKSFRAYIAEAIRRKRANSVNINWFNDSLNHNK